MDSTSQNSAKMAYINSLNRPTSHHQPYTIAPSLYSTQKPEPLKTYTFYQSTRNQQSNDLSFSQAQRKQYRFVTEGIDELQKNKVSFVHSHTPIYFDQEGKSKKQPQLIYPATEHQLKKRVEVSDVSSFQPYSTQQFMAQQKTKKFHEGQTAIKLQQSSSSQPSRFPPPELVESIITKSSVVSQQNGLYNLSNSQIERKLQAQTQIRYRNMQDDYNLLREKFFIIQAENKTLEQRNLDLVQQMLSSQSVIRDYEQKLKIVQENMKKQQGSIKISRNIIASLNDKIVRLQEENLNIAKKMEESYQEKLQLLEHSKNQEFKKAEKVAFEHRLLLIEEHHKLEEEMSKIIRDKEEEVQQGKKEKEMEVEGLLNQIRQLRQDIKNMNNDLRNLDQTNILLDQENNRLTQINQELKGNKQEIDRLLSQNNELQVKISFLTLTIEERNAAIDSLNGNILNYSQRINVLEEAASVYLSQKQFQSSLIQQLKMQLEQERQKSSFSGRKVEQESQEIVLLKGECQALRKQVSSIYEKLDNYIKGKQKDHSEISNLRQDAIARQGTISKLEEECASYEQLREKSEEKIVEKDQKITQLNLKLVNTQLEVQILKEQLNSNKLHEEQMRQKQEEAEQSVQQEYEQLQQRILQLQKKHENFEQTQEIEAPREIEQQEEQELDEQEVTQMQRQLMEATQNYQHEIRLKDILISTLKQSLQLKQQEIIELNLRLEQLSQQTAKQKSSSDITSDYLAQQFTYSLQLKEQLKLKQIQNQLLCQQLRCVKNQHLQLQKQIKVIEHYKFQYYNESDKIQTLQNKVKMAEEKEKEITAELEELKLLLKNQQEEYLITLDHQIKTISLMEEEDSLSPRIIKSLKNEYSSGQMSPQQLVTLREAKQEDEDEKSDYGQSFDYWLQHLNDHSKQQLISKVQELAFVNKSLHMKVSELNEVEESENDVIMHKIQHFQEVIEKYQVEINELQEQNQLLKTQNKQFCDKNQFLEGKVEWMDNLYKQVENNLHETNEEFLKVQVQLINLKLSTSTQTFEPDKQDSSESMEQPLQLQKQEVQSIKSQSEGGDLKESNLKSKENVIQQLKKISRQMQEQIQKLNKERDQQKKSSQKVADESKQKDVAENPKKMKEEPNPFAVEDWEYHELNKVVEGQYEIKELDWGKVTYSIVVSQVDSDEQQFQKIGMEDEVDYDEIIKLYEERQRMGMVDKIVLQQQQKKEERALAEVIKIEKQLIIEQISQPEVAQNQQIVQKSEQTQITENIVEEQAKCKKVCQLLEKEQNKHEQGLKDNEQKQEQQGKQQSKVCEEQNQKENISNEQVEKQILNEQVEEQEKRQLLCQGVQQQEQGKIIVESKDQVQVQEQSSKNMPQQQIKEETENEIKLSETQAQLAVDFEESNQILAEQAKSSKKEEKTE